MANIRPIVWMPWDGTIQTASSERIRILPRRPRNLASGVSATVTPRLMNDCLEMLNAQKELFTRLPSFRSIVAEAPHAGEPRCFRRRESIGSQADPEGTPPAPQFPDVFSNRHACGAVGSG